MKNDIKLTKIDYETHIEFLKRACDWAGVSIGRASKYIEILREILKDGINTPEKVLVYNESREIVDIFKFWKPHDSLFPGIKEKIKRCFKKGVVLREYEDPSTSTNRPRNDAFVLYLAGRLMKANIKVMAVEGIVARETDCHDDADITLEWEESVIDMQCKRPQTENAVQERAKEALKQLTKSNRQGQLGIIAIDCSVFIIPPWEVIAVESDEHARQYINTRLKNVEPKLKRCRKPNLLGLLLFARVPRTKTARSPILSPNGTPHIKYLEVYSLSHTLCLGNGNSHFIDMYKSLYERIKPVY